MPSQEGLVVVAMVWSPLEPVELCLGRGRQEGEDVKILDGRNVDVPRDSSRNMLIKLFRPTKEVFRNPTHVRWVGGDKGLGAEIERLLEKDAPTRLPMAEVPTLCDLALGIGQAK